MEKIFKTVIAPIGRAICLTEGKEYKAYGHEFESENVLFHIISDDGVQLVCSLYGDSKLYGQDWIIKE